MEVYADFGQSGDPVQALGLALPLLVPAVLLVVVSQSAWGRTPLRARPGGCAVLRDLLPSSALRYWTQVSALIFAAGVLAPVVVLLSQVEGEEPIWHAVRAARQEIRLSLALALGSAILTTLLAWPSARMLARRRSGGLWALYALPLTVPAPLFAIGLIHLWNRPLGTAIYGSPAMLLLAHVGRFLPFAAFALVAQFRQVDPLLHEAAQLHPVGWHRRAAYVHLPLLAPGLFATGGIVFVLSLGELGASLLVVSPGSATLSLRLFNLLHYGASGSVAGLALLLLSLVGGIGGLTLTIARGRGW
jgi:iron(III) transport system permease protein